MQRLLLIILLSFFLIVSCDKYAPKGLLSENQMIELMAEVHIIDGYLNTMPIDSSRLVIDGLYDQLFEKYHLDSISFQENVSYYVGNAVNAKQMYPRVMEKLNSYERVYRMEDSIRNAVAVDSIRKTSYFNKQKEEMRKLILEATKDTLSYDYLHTFSRFMEGVGVRVITSLPAGGIPVVKEKPVELDTTQATPKALKPLRPQRVIE